MFQTTSHFIRNNKSCVKARNLSVPVLLAVCPRAQFWDHCYFSYTSTTYQTVSPQQPVYMQMMHSCTEESLMTLMRVHYRMIWTTCKSGRKRG